MARITTIKPRVKVPPMRLAAPRDEAGRSRYRDQNDPWRPWYRTARWRDLRADVLTDAQFTCVMCGWRDEAMYQMHAMLAPLGAWKRGMIRSPLLVADHIKPHKGDEALFWMRNNIQCLCKPCHDGDKQAADRRGHR